MGTTYRKAEFHVENHELETIYQLEYLQIYRLLHPMDLSSGQTSWTLLISALLSQSAVHHVIDLQILFRIRYR
jgi:hypothetical protein